MKPTQTENTTSLRPRWLRVKIAVLLISLSPIAVIIGSNINTTTEPSADLHSADVLKVEALEKLKLRDITSDLQLVCVNGYVYMKPKLSGLFLTPLLINGHDQSTGLQLVECDRYEKYYNKVSGFVDGLGQP